MPGLRKRGEMIRQFILDNVKRHPTDIVALTSESLGISRQAVAKHVHQLVARQKLVASGATRNRRYALATVTRLEREYSLEGLQEDVAWRNDIAPIFSDLPENVRRIWLFGFTEMMNNAIDHSSGTVVTVLITRTAIDCTMWIHDDGEGIFKKIQRELGLDDEHHAVLELAKGKLTTDPARHSGEGIFFASWMFDFFVVFSGNSFFSHNSEIDRDLVFGQSSDRRGTLVIMQLSNNATRTTEEVYDSFTSGDDYEFTRTVVSVRLAQYGDETLVSRSQAKRLLARCDRFKAVVLDFQGVDSIGQAFADEVFRVFCLHHPQVVIVETNTSKRVQQMIDRARQAAGRSCINSQGEKGHNER